MKSTLVAGLIAVLMLTTGHGVGAASDAPTADGDDVVVTFTPGKADPGGAAVEDASGCNINVCIYLTGSGLVLSQWRTTAYVASATCTRASFWANGTRVRQSATYCSSGPGTISATWTNPGSFTNGTQACNSWTVVSGYPCKTIQS